MSASFRHRLRNAAQTAVLVLGMAGLMALAGWLLAGSSGVWWAGGLTVLALALTPRLNSRPGASRPGPDRKSTRLNSSH